jgi:lysylphosphatidylglycerol synthetase-like protein (DUF2156 family)
MAGVRHVNASGSRAWIRAALLVGATYLLIGKVFALPVHHARAWRLAAWAVSGGAYAAHIWYEHSRLRSAPRVMALHAALAVAIGAAALAVAGMLHALATTSTIRPAWLIALVAWPAITAVPAFLGALAAGALSRRKEQGR